VAFGAACVVFALAALALQRVPLPLVALAPFVFVGLAGALALMPAGSAPARPSPPPRWDLPARMVITTALVVALTAAAPVLGAKASGLLATFPLYAAILTVFAHATGPGPAVQVLRGLLLGLFSFAAFFVALGALLERVGLAAAFTGATVVALVVQAGSLGLLLATPGSSRLGRA
jgi:hypothetical protein